MTKRELKWTDLDEFTRAYAEAALWSSTHGEDDDREFLDEDLGIEDIATETLEAMKKDCDKFREDNKALLEQAEELGRTESDCGHDFWLTRNGHGVGFWDRGLGDIGDLLSDACRHTEIYLWVDEDNKIHHD